MAVDDIASLAVQIAEVKGAIDALIQLNAVRFTEYERRLGEMTGDLGELRRDVEHRQQGADSTHVSLAARLTALEAWQARILGGGTVLGAFVGLLSVYAALHAARILP